MSNYKHPNYNRKCTICSECMQSDYNENDMLFCTKNGELCSTRRTRCVNFIKEE